MGRELENSRGSVLTGDGCKSKLESKYQWQDHREDKDGIEGSRDYGKRLVIPAEPLKLSLETEMRGEWRRLLVAGLGLSKTGVH